MADTPATAGAPGAPAPAEPRAPAPAPAAKPAPEPGSDEHEAEYQAALAKARGDQDDDDRAEPRETGAGDDAEETEENAGDKKSWKLKVDGEEREVDEPNMVKFAQIGMAAQKRFEAAKQMETRATQFVNLLKTNPKAVLTNPKLGLEPARLKEFCEQYLWQGIEESRLTPEQRQQRANEQELEKFRDNAAKEKARSEERRREKAKETLRQEFAKEIIEAIEGSDLPRTDFAVQRMAFYKRAAIKKGLNVTAAQLVPLVRKDFVDHQRQFFSSTPDDKLIEVLGEDQVQRVRKANLVKRGVTGNQPARTASAPAAAPAASAPRFNTAEELRDAAIARARGKR